MNGHTWKRIKDRAPKAMREQVVAAASQAWQEPVWALWLGRAYRTRILFEVPGLRHDGTLRGDHKSHWFFGRLPWGLAMVLGHTVTTLCSLFWLTIQTIADSVIWGDGPGGFFDGSPLNWRRKHGELRWPDTSVIHLNWPGRELYPFLFAPTRPGTHDTWLRRHDLTSSSRTYPLAGSTLMH